MTRSVVRVGLSGHQELGLCARQAEAAEWQWNVVEI